MPSTKPTQPINWSVLLLLIAILFGALVRIMPALVTRFPLNDGGMFLDMTRDLQANHFLLPAITTYNGLDLPYAYPPLGFYLTSLLADLGRIPLLVLFTWLPAFLAILTIPAFYFFARACLRDDLRAALATVIFALAPHSYGWHIMGGGVTRALGLTFLLLGARHVLILFRDHTDEAFPRKRLALAVLFCSLAVLSHPEVAAQTAGMCALFWLFLGRTRRGVTHAAIVALGVALVTALWWGTVLLQHGLAPFLSAAQTGAHSTTSWLNFFTESYALIGFLPFLLFLRIAGTVYALIKRQWMWLALLFVPYLIDPRSGGTVSALVFSLFSALALLDGFPEWIAAWRKREPHPLTESRAGGILLLALAFFQFVDCGLNNYSLINTTLAPDERAAMQWVQDNPAFSPNTQFILLTGKPYSMSDPVQEWFPTLSGQHSQTTLQGLEWTLSDRFGARLTDLVSLQACADMACIHAWSQRTGLPYEAVWVSIPSGKVDAERHVRMTALSESLAGSFEYRVIYDATSANERVVIFSRVFVIQ